MICPNCGAQIAEGSVICDSCGTAIENLPPQEPVTAPNKQKTFRAVRNLIFAVLGLIALVVAFFVIKGFINRDSAPVGNACAYLSDGNFQLLTDLTGGDPVKIDSLKSDTTYESMLRFSPDGKYVYYFSDFGKKSYAGTLCRAEYGKLTSDSSGNEKYIVEIDSNVLPGFSALKGGVVYQTKDGNLMCYNGKKTAKIAENIINRFDDGDSRVLYSSGIAGSGYDICSVTLSKPESSKVLASDTNGILDATDFDNVYYTSLKGDEDERLYVTSFDGEPKELTTSPLAFISVANGTVQFAEQSGSLNLYDIVTDTYAELDANIKEPNIEDYYSEAMSDYDYLAYYEAMDSYASVSERNDLREALKATEHPYYSISICQNGEKTQPLGERQLLDFRVYSDAILFNTTDMEHSAVSMDDIVYVSDLYNAMNLDYTAENYIYSIPANKVFKLSAKAAQQLGEIQQYVYPMFYATETEIFMGTDGNGVFKAKINGTDIESFDLISAASVVLAVKNNVLYYGSNYSSKYSFTSCDVNSYFGGESKCLVTSALSDNIYVYEDGSVIAFTGDPDTGSRQLSIMDKDGKATVIADDVKSFERADKNTVLYMSGSGLYSYDGKESRLISSNADYLWVQSKVEPAAIISAYGFYDHTDDPV